MLIEESHIVWTPVQSPICSKGRKVIGPTRDREKFLVWGDMENGQIGVHFPGAIWSMFLDEMHYDGLFGVEASDAPLESALASPVIDRLRSADPRDLPFKHFRLRGHFDAELEVVCSDDPVFAALSDDAAVKSWEMERIA